MFRRVDGGSTRKRFVGMQVTVADTDEVEQPIEAER